MVARPVWLRSAAGGPTSARRSNGGSKLAGSTPATAASFWLATQKHALRKWRFRPATRDGVAVSSVKTLTGLEHFPLRTGCGKNRRAQQMVGRRVLPFALRLLSILREAQEFLLQLFQQDVDLAQTVRNLVETALPCVRAGCVTNVDSLCLLPGAGEST